jgi:hypothetical protein
MILRGAAMGARARRTTSVEERIPAPATPGKIVRSASGPPIDATAKPKKRAGGIRGAAITNALR